MNDEAIAVDMRCSGEHAAEKPRLESAPAPSPAPSRPYRDWSLNLMIVAVGLLGISLLYKGSVGYWHRLTSPAPPSVPLERTDPQVVRAIELARKEVEQAPGSAETWGVYGEVLRAHEYEDAATSCFRQAEILDPTDPRWPYLLARGLRVKAPDEALRCLERSVQREREVRTPRLVLAETLMDRGRMEEAEAHLKTVLAANPHDPRALLGLGRIEFARGEMDAAARHLEESTAIAPRVKATRSVLAQAYHRLGKSNAASGEMRAIASLREDWSWHDPYQEEVMGRWVGLKARLSLASELWKQRKREETIKVLRALIGEYPRSEQAQFMLGDKLSQMGRFAEAEAPLRLAIAIAPEMSRAHFDLGYCLHQMNRVDEAADGYRRAIELQPDYAVAHYNLSHCLSYRGDREGAIRAVREAIRLKPEIAKAHRHLATLLAEQGRSDEARRATERADRLDNPAKAIAFPESTASGPSETPGG